MLVLLLGLLLALLPLVRKTCVSVLGVRAKGEGGSSGVGSDDGDASNGIICDDTDGGSSLDSVNQAHDERNK